MKDEPKKPDLRDSAPKTSVTPAERTVAGENDTTLNSEQPDLVKPSPGVQAPGQTTKG